MQTSQPDPIHPKTSGHPCPLIDLNRPEKGQMRVKAVLKEALLALCGGCLYALLELIWRGHSHWTMALLGGVCFALIGLLNETSARQMPLIWQALIGSACIITPLEFITGCVVNLWLGWGVWDYSDLPLNLMGQICLPFALLWVPVAMAAVLLDDWLRWRFFREKPPRYTLLFPVRARS